MGLDGGIVLEEGDDIGDDPEGQEGEEINSEDEFLAQDASIQEVVYGEEIEFDAERGGFESGVYQQSLRARRFHKSHFQRSRK